MKSLSRRYLSEIIDSNNDLIGGDDIPQSGSDLETQANKTTDHNKEIGTQPFTFDMLGRFGFTLFPFMENKENDVKNKIIDDLKNKLRDNFIEIVEYYYRNPNKLKSDFRKIKEGDFPEELKNFYNDWNEKLLKTIENYINNNQKKRENIDESQQTTFSFDDMIKSELKGLLRGSKYDKGGILQQRIDQLMNIHSPWLEKAKRIYGAEEIASKLYQYEKNLNGGLTLQETTVVEDKVVNKKIVDVLDKRNDDKEVREKKIEKIAGLINKLEKKDIDKLINLLERK